MIPMKTQFMTAEEVLRRYAEGERNFENIILKGQSFRGKKLSGANFSGSDIRGTDFSSATLSEAKFINVTAGLPFYIKLTLMVSSLIISFLSGLFASITGLSIFNSITEIAYQKPLFLAISLITAMLSVLLATVMSVHLSEKVINSYKASLSIANLIAVLLAAVGLTLGMIIGINFVASTTITNTARMLIIGLVTATLSQALVTGLSLTSIIAYITFGQIASELSILLGVLGTIIGTISSTTSERLVILLIATVTAGIGQFCSQGARDGKVTWALTRKAGTFFTCIGGTNFKQADLSYADFTTATIKSSNFNGANLTYIRWKDAKISFSRLGNTYLDNLKIQQTLITLNGQKQNFDNLNFENVNLKGAELQDASFIGANLNQANLKDANLSGAKLKQTQLDEADLTGATLTGATIEDWGITSLTKLQGVRCRYVFMRLPTKDNPNPRRKPDHWESEFDDGDFADFIKPIVDTLDLYHNQGVDPRAIAISLKQLAENNPEAELEIVAMEKRGKDKFLLRAATAPDADHSDLYAEYSKIHNHIKALAESEVQALLTEKDSQIPFLRTTIETLLKVQLETVQQLQRPSFYVQKYNNQGDTMSNAPRKYTKNDFSGSTFMGGFVNADTSYAHQIGRDINNYPPEQRQNLADAAAEIQQLLQQLEQTYPNATEIEKQSALAVTLQQEIKQNPTFRTRLRNALKEGGIEALKVLFAPIGIPIEMVRGWIEAEAE
ncbi:Pentapeptide repeat protein [Coleofasciculus chthonoplastes PCC 7420]|uniref:Pentapeptide repeat protein n=2 Tax=Coleofasciculus chthonoplastes TaxID=64178 RepID=B4W2V7_9CYAN|nr:Pentapeptide repeat protein [Coleofasciculus chthonoplastes PCC 7420]